MAKGLPKWIITKYGITKKAWEVYRSGAKKPKTEKRSGTKTTSKGKGKGKGGGKKLFGTVGIKGMLVGTALLTAAKFLVRKYAPVGEKYVTPVSMIGAGIVGKTTGIGGAALLTTGIMDGASELATDLVLGGFGALRIGGGAPNGEYDL